MKFSDNTTKEKARCKNCSSVFRWSKRWFCWWFWCLFASTSG